MKLDARIQQRFDELAQASSQIEAEWHKWSTSVLNLLQNAFGSQSIHYQNLRRIYDSRYPLLDPQAPLDIFRAAKEDYEGGYIFSLEKAVSGEVFGDFVLLAKQSLDEGHKDVAAVLACAALEDALQRYACAEGIDVAGAEMTTVVNALKSKGLVNAAQKTLLEAMPKIRNYAMHANWDKIRREDVGSVIGFVEWFLLEKF